MWQIDFGFFFPFCFLVRHALVTDRFWGNTSDDSRDSYWFPTTQRFEKLCCFVIDTIDKIPDEYPILKLA